MDSQLTRRSLLRAVGDRGDAASRQRNWRPVAGAALDGLVDAYALTHEGTTDHHALNIWLAGKRGAPSERQSVGEGMR